MFYWVQHKKSFIICLILLGMVAPASSLWAKKTKAKAKERWDIEGQYSAPEHKSYEQFYEDKNAAKRTKEAARLRNKTIASIEKLLKGKLDRNDRYQLQIRLADLLSEKYQVTSQRVFLNRAISVYRRIIKKFSRRKDLDRVYFALAFHLSLIGDKTYPLYHRRLIKRFPQSSFLPDSYLALGEYHFERHEVALAIKNYKKVIPFKNSKAYLFAIYKLGWCYFNLAAKDKKMERKNHQKSLAAFKLVVKQGKENGGVNQLNLRNEALMDMVFVYAETGDTRGAWSYFQKIKEKDYFRKILMRLAWTHNRKGDYTAARGIYLRLLKEFPLHKDVHVVMEKIVTVSEKKKDFPGVLKYLKLFTHKYSKKSAWYQKHQKDKEAIAGLEETKERLIRVWGKTFHLQGQDPKRVKQQKMYYGFAMDTYRLYLISFEPSNSYFEIKFLLAELLYSFEKYNEAAGHYLEVAASNYQERVELSAKNAIFSFEKAFEKSKIKTPKLTTKALPIPTLLQKVVSSCDRYLEVVKNDSVNDRMWAKMKAARIYYTYSNFKEAFKRLQKVIDEHSSSKTAKTAARMILHVHHRDKNWAKLYQTAKEMMANTKLIKGGFQKELLQIVKNSHFKMGEDLEGHKKYVKAADMFLSYFKDFNGDKFADRALFRASLNYEKAKDYAKSIHALSLLDKSFPKSKLHGDTLIRMGFLNESIMNFSKAAHYYERFARKYPSRKEAQNSLLNAAVIHESLEKVEDSYRCYKHFIRLFPRVKEVEVRFSLVEHGIKLEEYKDAKAHLKYIADRAEKIDDKILAMVQLWRVSSHLGKENLSWLTKADKLFKQSQKNHNLTNSAKELAAVKFESMDRILQAYFAINLKNPKMLGKDLDRKKYLMGQIKQKYSEIMDLGDPEYGVASLYQLGFTVQNMAESLSGAVAPAGLGKDDEREFRSQLDQLIFPLEEESFVYYKTAFDKSMELGVYSLYQQKAYQALNKLDPAKYSQSEEMGYSLTFGLADFNQNEMIKDLIQ